MTELIDRYLRRLQESTDKLIHPEVERISGLVPEDVDAEELYRAHLAAKHRCG
jgi:hypothetical protein